MTCTHLGQRRVQESVAPDEFVGAVNAGQIDGSVGADHSDEPMNHFCFATHGVPSRPGAMTISSGEEFTRLTQIQSGLASVQKGTAKIDPEMAAKAGVQEHIALISRTLTDCEKMCAALEKSIAEHKTDSAALSAECKVIEQHLDVVRKEETAMLKKMGITLPETRQEGKDKEVKK